MKHKDQGRAGPLIGTFEPVLAKEGSRQCWTEVGPLEKSVEEARHLLGSAMVDHPHIVFNLCSKEMGREDLTNSNPEYPAGFKDFIGVVGPYNQAHMQRMSLEIVECDNSSKKGIETNQSVGESHGSFQNSVEKVPQSLW